MNKKEFNYQMTKYKLSDILEIIPCKTFMTEKSEEGENPLYGATQLNEPVKFIKNYSINTYDETDFLIKRYGVLCINKTGNGGAGICFVRRGTFAINSSIMMCKMKIYISIQNAGFMSYQLHQIFNRANSLNLQKFDEVYVNLLDDEINLLTVYEIKMPIQINEIKEWKKLKIGDYFEIMSVKKKFLKTQPEGKYPLISSSGTNNGISKYINDYSFEGECLTIARNGTVGSCFYQNGIFGITSDVLILTKKRDLNYHIWAMMINYILPKKYSYSNKLTIEKLLNEIILIPIFN